MKKQKMSQHICCLLLLGFLLGVRDGRIALWKDDQQEPWKIFPYPIAVLPADTQQKLISGIRVDSMDDLNKLLENLLS